MPIQTSVSNTMPIGFPGTKRTDMRTMTGINTEATAEMTFGYGVVRDMAAGNLTSRQATKLPAAATDKFMGVIVRDDLSDRMVGANQNGPKPGTPVLIGFNGSVLVKVESAVVKDGRAFMRFAAGAGGSILGAFRADADTNTAVELKGCYFEHSGAAGSLVWLFVDVAATRAAAAS